jgi:ribosomal protein S7
MAINLGIANIQQAIIFDLLSMASTWAKPEIINNQHFYWVARQHISRELPFLKLKLDSIYRHLKHLDKIGLIVYKKSGKKDCIILTEKGKSYYVGNKSGKQENNETSMPEINPNKLGNKSEKHSENFPTDQTTIDYQTTRVSKEINKEKAKEIFEFWKSTFKHQKAKLDSKRESILISAIKLGYPVEDLKSAIIGCSKSAFHMGKNKDKKIYDGIHIIFKGSEKIEGFMRDALSVNKETTEESSNRIANEVIELRRARENYKPKPQEKTIEGVRI